MGEVVGTFSRVHEQFRNVFGVTLHTPIKPKLELRRLAVEEAFTGVLDAPRESWGKIV